MCFLVPLTQAVVTTVYRVCTKQTDTFVGRNLKTLELMLWGGSIMLVVDHLVNGEFFAWNPMELLTVGLPMSLAVTAIWAVYCYAKERKVAQA
jgi:ACR3 family arsenite efflux pump ArsB